MSYIRRIAEEFKKKLEKKKEERTLFYDMANKESVNYSDSIVKR